MAKLTDEQLMYGKCQYQLTNFTRVTCKCFINSNTDVVINKHIYKKTDQH